MKKSITSLFVTVLLGIAGTVLADNIAKSDPKEDFLKAASFAKQKNYYAKH